MTKEPTWQSIAHRDPFLAGSIATRESHESFAEEQSDSIGLLGEAREKFLAGWQEALRQDTEEVEVKLKRELDALELESLRGDPANY